jgi:hypothetical protein
MTDIFEAIANKSNRLVLEVLAKKPASTQATLVSETKLTAEQAQAVLLDLVSNKLVKKTGTTPNAKYSIIPAGFSPYLAWLGKVAEAQAVAAIEQQLNEVGEKVGSWLATSADWVSEKVGEQVQLDIDPKRWGQELGRKLAEAKVDIQTEADKVVKEVKNRVKR